MQTEECIWETAACYKLVRLDGKVNMIAPLIITQSMSSAAVAAVQEAISAAAVLTGINCVCSILFANHLRHSHDRSSVRRCHWQRSPASPPRSTPRQPCH